MEMKVSMGIKTREGEGRGGGRKGKRTGVGEVRGGGKKRGRRRRRRREEGGNRRKEEIEEEGVVGDEYW